MNTIDKAIQEAKAILTELRPMLERDGYELSTKIYRNTSKLLTIVEQPNDDIAFIKRWVQRVHDNETTLEEFYGVLRYYEPLKPLPKGEENEGWVFTPKQKQRVKELLAKTEPQGED